jgi:hypothetical protein
MVVPVPREGAFRAAICPQHALAIPPWHGFDFRFHEKFILKKYKKEKIISVMDKLVEDQIQKIYCDGVR